MGFRYNPFQRASKIICRRFFPIVPVNPYKKGPVEDICRVDYFPAKMIRPFFSNCIRTLQKVKGDDIGDYLEFGVFNGSSMSNMYVTAKKLGVKMRFFGFDAFKGLPKESEKEDDGVWEEGFYACSFEKMKEFLKKKKVNPKNINWIKGWYKDTLNQRVIEKYKINKIGIVFIDCDTHSSSKTVLGFLGPLIKEPAIMCLDDWKLNDLDVKGKGEYKSFNEFLEKNTHLKAREIKSYNRKSKTFIIEPAY